MSDRVIRSKWTAVRVRNGVVVARYKTVASALRDLMGSTDTVIGLKKPEVIMLGARVRPEWVSAREDF